MAGRQTMPEVAPASRPLFPSSPEAASPRAAPDLCFGEAVLGALDKGARPRSLIAHGAQKGFALGLALLGLHEVLAQGGYLTAERAPPRRAVTLKHVEASQSLLCRRTRAARRRPDPGRPVHHGQRGRRGW